MAIKKFNNKAEISSSDFEGLFVGLNNGDQNALNEVLRMWNFKDEETFLKFAIALMVKSGGNKKLYIEDGQGNKISILPSDDLLKPTQQ